jgi:hypothetical protein
MRERSDLFYMISLKSSSKSFSLLRNSPLSNRRSIALSFDPFKVFIILLSLAYTESLTLGSLFSISAGKSNLAFESLFSDDELVSIKFFL